MLSKKNVKRLNDHGIDLIINEVENYHEEYSHEKWGSETGRIIYGKIKGGIATYGKFCRIGNTDGLSVYKDTGCRQHSCPGFEVMFWEEDCPCCNSGSFYTHRSDLNEEDKFVERVIAEFSN